VTCTAAVPNVAKFGLLSCVFVTMPTPQIVAANATVSRPSTSSCSTLIAAIPPSPPSPGRLTAVLPAHGLGENRIPAVPPAQPP
jgi:hypothetical protein